MIKWVPNYEGVAFDDIYTFNPQAGSQWDGFRHFSTTIPGQKDRVFHGGTTGDEIINSQSTRIGMGHWAKEGIAGRGFLIDYVSWAEKQGRSANGLDGTMVTLDEVYAIAKECRIEFRKGDMFFLRVGLTKSINAMSLEEKKEYRSNTAARKHAHSGLEQSSRVVRFLWDNHITACASDGVSFEVRPNKGWNGEDPHAYDLHNFLLAGWGVPIGEMFNLEDLAEVCKRLGRWTFFVTSAPLNVPRGCSSPPNCMAIF